MSLADQIFIQNCKDIIENGVTENGGTLDFSYTIDFNNVTASENELLVTVTPKMEE